MSSHLRYTTLARASIGAVYIPLYLMHTPYFPAFRPRLAALGQRSLRRLRRHSLAQFGTLLETCLPACLLAMEEEGLNSRERIYTLYLTFQCFLWQMLKPRTACREVVRQVQAISDCRAGTQCNRGPAPIARPGRAYLANDWKRL